MSHLLKPRFHGNGFIQIYLNPTTRMHIWNPAELPASRVVNAQIHDHRFWLESTVLLGELHHVEYDFEIDKDGEYRRYEVVPATKNKAGYQPHFIGRYRETAKRRFSYKAGDTYTFGGPGKFHETFCNELTMTIMTKVDQDPDYLATLMVTGSREPDHAFAEAGPHPWDMIQTINTAWAKFMGSDVILDWYSFELAERRKRRDEKLAAERGDGR